MYESIKDWIVKTDKQYNSNKNQTLSFQSVYEQKKYIATHDLLPAYDNEVLNISYLGKL